MLNASSLTLANITWLLAAMAFVIAPHVQRLPIWVTVACVLAGGWRWWIARRGLRVPAWWMMGLFAAAVAAGAFLEYRRLFGREVGVTLLIVMLCLKILEMKMKRDAVLVIFLGFFLALTNFLYSQTLAMGAYMLICVWAFMATLIGFNRINTEPTLKERIAPAGWLLLQSIPLMLVLFFLFPRLSGPLWSMPQENAARTGLSDTMSPGDISKLSQSDAIAFRVEFTGAVPDNTDLYWRGPVMGNNLGRTWAPYYVRETATLDYTPESPAISYRVTLQPHAKPWLFALDMPAVLPKDAAFTADYQIRSQRPISSLMAYEMKSHLRYRAGLELGDRERKAYLAYPSSMNPRTIALGKSLREQYPDDQALIESLLARYNREFTYTFEPPLLGQHSVDEFLFDTKLGFCEHYAGSFALVMRAAGIPSRVVTGYQGGEVNPVTRQLVVRQAEAHAWTEVWLEDRGWTRVDPTFAVSPLRINRGISAALGPQGVVDTLIDADKLGLLRQIRYGWDAINTQWNAWVVGFNQDRQRNLLDNFGIPDADWRTLAIWLIAGVFLTSGSVGLFLLARAYALRPPVVIAAYNRFCASLAKQGIVRAPHEGPLDFLARIRREQPALAARAEVVIERYVAVRYSRDADTPDALAAFKQAVAQFARR